MCFNTNETLSYKEVLASNKTCIKNNIKVAFIRTNYYNEHLFTNKS